MDDGLLIKDIDGSGHQKKEKRKKDKKDKKHDKNYKKKDSTDASELEKSIRHHSSTKSKHDKVRIKTML